MSGGNFQQTPLGRTSVLLVTVVLLAACSESGPLPPIVTKPKNPVNTHVSPWANQVKLQTGLTYSPGLTRTSEFHIPNDPQGTSHSTEMVVDDAAGLIYIADSFGGVVAYKLDGTGNTVFHVYGDSGQLHCNTIALHAASHSLYCAAADHLGIAIVNVPDGTIRDLTEDPSKLIGYHNIVVVGDTLYAANQLSGMDVFPIQPNGELGASTHVLGNITIERLATDGSSLYGAGSALGLVEINADFTTRMITALDGPVIRMRVHDGQAAVALGSQGALLVDVQTGEPLSTQHPKCVVTSADAHANVFAFGCYTGMFVYDLAKQRVFGWDRMRFGALDSVFAAGHLIVTDWWYLYHYQLDPTGYALDVDYPPGYVIKPADSLQFAIRNPGDLTLHVLGQELGPYGEAQITVPPSSEAVSHVSVATDEGSSTTAKVVVVRTGPYPALGTTFFIKGMENSYIYFSAMTCALQFPAMRDMGWLSERGMFPRGLTPKIIDAEGSHVDASQPDTWMQKIAPMFAPLQFYSLEMLYPGDIGLNTYNASLDTQMYIAGGDNDNEYFIDSTGTVVDYSRVYWGAFPPR